jgi:toxin ParE1/3/4
VDEGTALCPAAEDDLKEIWTFSAQRWDVDQADRYVRDIHTTCERLATGDLPGLPIEDVRPGYRRRPAGSHVVYYRESAESLTVVRILHQRMDVRRHLDQD